MARTTEQRAHLVLRAVQLPIRTTQLVVLVTFSQSAHLLSDRKLRWAMPVYEPFFGKNFSTVASLGGFVIIETHTIATVEQAIIAATGMSCQ